jgi:type IV pilus assembly protein PilM
MAWFAKKPSSFLGVDLGTGGAKLVELVQDKGRAKLMTYGFSERDPGALPNNLLEQPDETASLLREMAKRARATTNQCVAAIPAASVWSVVANVPNVEDRNLKEAIQAQAKKFIPVPLDELQLDYKLIGNPSLTVNAPPPFGSAAPASQTAVATKTRQVLITGASRATIRAYVDLFHKAGLSLVSLETEVFALIRSLIGRDRASTLIVDVGSRRTNLVVVEDGIPIVTRSLDVGGDAFTAAMAGTLAVDPLTAEKMKRDVRGISSLYPDQGLPKMFAAVVAPLLSELHYTVSLYSRAEEGTGAKGVEKVILTGGASLLPALGEAIKAELGVRTYVGDPWARVVYPEELRPALDEIGPRFAVPVGLAMYGIE